MYCQLVLVILLSTFNLAYFYIIKDDKSHDMRRLNSQQNCEDRIYRKCNHRSDFTQQEVQIVGEWIQNEFRTKAKYPPIQKPCKKFYVRKEIKCMTHDERMELIRVLRILYENGAIEKFADFHLRYWPAAHKSYEKHMWHRWFSNQMEKQLRLINPNVYMPHWTLTGECSHLEKSLVWDYFGHSGNYANGYCLRDGPLYHKLNIARCVKRQWPEDGILPPITCPILDTVALQLATNFSLLYDQGIGQHQKLHDSIGGYFGDMSTHFAPYDWIFYPFHSYALDVLQLQWQLLGPEFLTPVSYNDGWHLNRETGGLKPSNIMDIMTGYNTTVLEAFQVGFGELCGIPDSIMQPILDIVRGTPTPLPLMYHRMPDILKNLTFPRVLRGDTRGFTYAMGLEVGNCNWVCRPLPFPLGYKETPELRRTLTEFKEDGGFDISHIALKLEAAINGDITLLNANGYCDPYVTD